jgi:uncharacterized protein (TIGR02145 family)
MDNRSLDFARDDETTVNKLKKIYMKKKLLLMMMCWPAMLAAQGNGVKVSNLAVSAGSPTTVTFDVSWSKTGMPDVWSDTVWVWVDYNQNGKMERLPVTGATLTATSASGVGKVVKDAGNNQGVWVVGNARSAGSFSATVRLFTTASVVAGACAYASNYPPVGKYSSSDASEILFTGTPMYDLVLKKVADGSTYSISTTGRYSIIHTNEVIQSFTDATNAPGRLYNTPPYAASTQTWTIVHQTGNQTWSDVINIPECNKQGTHSCDIYEPICRSYTANGITSYYYNWQYVTENYNKLCPMPWRVPSAADFVALDIKLGGDGKNRNPSSTWIQQQYEQKWGLTRLGGIECGGTGMKYYGNYGQYLSSTAASSTQSVYFLTHGTVMRPNYTVPAINTVGIAVRCVR